MNKLSTLAQQKACELGITLSANEIDTLCTYDEDFQVRWIVNPGMEYFIQNTNNQIISNLMAINSKNVVNTPQATNNNTNNITNNDSDSDSDSDGDIGFGLFD